MTLLPPARSGACARSALLGESAATSRSSRDLHCDSIEAACHACIAAARPKLALVLLMRAYQHQLRRFCAGLLRDEELARDVVQVVFFQAYRTLTRFEARSSLKNWLYGIARHRCLDELCRRRSWRRMLAMRAVTAELTVDPHDPREEEQARARTSALHQCLARLRPRDRELLLLRFQGGLSYDEIAARLGDNSGALRVRACRLLRMLRRSLQLRQ
jgi:RNA polymerase sigma-70 factor (ECF subfamily)